MRRRLFAFAVPTIKNELLDLLPSSNSCRPLNSKFFEDRNFIVSKLDNQETMCEYDYCETLPTYVCLAKKHEGGAWDL
ncbi:hypothetical protein L596_013261 [Steinernema carpocapsae]|uniref:Uncharacterized protein n=1 Tax=Steinernema carpocapsae TaxID=34508 RepID=A0A4U5NZT0_STECR|nr:hypothetical protein L596_013261 [Steinernema carpocapsae]